MPSLMQRLLAQRTCQLISHDWSTYHILQVHSGSCYLAGSRHAMLPLISHVLQGHMFLKSWTTCHSAVVCMSVIFVFLRFSLLRCCNNSMFPNFKCDREKDISWTTTCNQHQDRSSCQDWASPGEALDQIWQIKAVIRMFRQSMCLWIVWLNTRFFGVVLHVLGTSMYLVGQGVQ